MKEKFHKRFYKWKVKNERTRPCTQKNFSGLLVLLESSSVTESDKNDFSRKPTFMALKYVINSVAPLSVDPMSKKLHR